MLKTLNFESCIAALKFCCVFVTVRHPTVLLPFSYFQLALLLVLAFSCSAFQYDGECENNQALNPRPHSVSLLEFGAVGDGKTLNTVAFQNAIFYVKSFADKGGAQLYVPPGRWLTGSFNLTSHLTLFLETGAIILGSQVKPFNKIFAIPFCSDKIINF